MTMRAILDKLQTTSIYEAFLPYDYNPTTISNFVRDLLEQETLINQTDFSSLKKIYEIKDLEDDLKTRIFFLCIKAGIIESYQEGCLEDEEGGSEEFYDATPIQQQFILSTIELLSIKDWTELNFDVIAMLFQDVTDNYDAVFDEIKSIPKDKIAQILSITSSPFGTEKSGTKKAFELKFFLLLPETELSSDNWVSVEILVEKIIELIDEKDKKLLFDSLQDVYTKIKDSPQEKRAGIIRRYLLI